MQTDGFLTGTNQVRCKRIQEVVQSSFKVQPLNQKGILQGQNPISEMIWSQSKSKEPGSCLHKDLTKSCLKVMQRLHESRVPISARIKSIKHFLALEILTFVLMIQVVIKCKLCKILLMYNYKLMSVLDGPQMQLWDENPMQACLLQLLIVYTESYLHS